MLLSNYRPNISECGAGKITTNGILQSVHVVMFEMAQGGESTREEMCFSFLYYYPETPMGYCTGFQLFSNEFLTAQNFK